MRRGREGKPVRLTQDTKPPFRRWANHTQENCKGLSTAWVLLEKPRPGSGRGGAKIHSMSHTTSYPMLGHPADRLATKIPIIQKNNFLRLTPIV